MKFITYKEKRNSSGRLIRKYRIYNFGVFKLKKKVIPVLGDNNKIIIGGREISAEEKELLDKFGKITIEGNNNIIELPNIDDLMCDIRMEGNENIISIGKRNLNVNDKKVIDSKAILKIEGNNNRINFIDIFNVQCDSNIIGNSNKIYVGKIRCGASLSCDMRNNFNYRELYIEDIVGITNWCWFILYGNNRKIHVGKDCMFAVGICIKTTDAHPIYDLETNQRINANKDVIIGEHVWIGRDAYVSKGTVIPAGCVVGARSFVNKVFTKENCVIAGIPAKVVKENIRWDYPLG